MECDRPASTDKTTLESNRMEGQRKQSSMAVRQQPCRSVVGFTSPRKVTPGSQCTALKRHCPWRLHARPGRSLRATDHWGCSRAWGHACAVSAAEDGSAADGSVIQCCRLTASPGGAEVGVRVTCCCQVEALPCTVALSWLDTRARSTAGSVPDSGENTTRLVCSLSTTSCVATRLICDGAQQWDPQAGCDRDAPGAVSNEN